MPWSRTLKWTALALLGLTVLAGLVLAALDEGYLRGPLLHVLAASAGRQIRVDGPLRVRLFSRQPLVIAERVTVGNPPWSAPGVTAEIGKVTLKFASLRFGELEGVGIEGATLRLRRDSAGHANWQWTNPDRGPGRGLPPIHSLSMAGVRVLLDDALRHLQFDGTVSAAEVGGSAGTAPLRVEGSGKLNGRTASFNITGEPLRSARRDKPYGFTFSARSSGSRITGGGSLLRPFDLKAFDASFEAAGADLKDLYYLVGVAFVDTGKYHLSGKLAHRGFDAAFSNLVVTFGQSDIRGSASVKRSGARSSIDADLNSQLLRLSDLGASAAGRDSEAKAAQGESARGESAQGLLLSDEMVDLGALRRLHAGINYRASRVEAGRLALLDVAAKVTIDQGVLTVSPLSAELLEGKLRTEFKVDAQSEIPRIAIDGRIDDVQLGQYQHDGSGAPAIEGPLSAKFTLTGRGRSIHQIAASADGTISATLTGGAVRDSFAELTGIDLRGLGLLLAKDKKEVPVRCGIANFQAHDGTLTAKNLVLDTAPVLIEGGGFVHLETETLDLTLRGYPKHVRFFQLRSPIVIRGTLKAPSIGIQAHDSKMVLIDPGKAKDADCESLLQ